MSIHLKNKEEMEYSKVYTYYVSYKEPKKDRKEYHFYSSPEIDEYLQHEKIEYVKDDKQNFFKVLCITSEIKDKEIERLHSIIKEARELLNQELYSVMRKGTIIKVREILDKENK